VQHPLADQTSSGPRTHARWALISVVIAVLATMAPATALAQAGDRSPTTSPPASATTSEDGRTVVVVPLDCPATPTSTSTTSTTAPVTAALAEATTGTVPSPCAPIEITDDGGGDADQHQEDKAEPVPGYTGGGPVISSNPVTEIAPGAWQRPVVVVGAQARQAAAEAVAAAEAQAREYERAAEQAERIVTQDRESLSRLDLSIVAARDAERAADEEREDVLTEVEHQAADLYIGSPDTSTALPTAIGGNEELDWQARQVSSNAVIDWIVDRLNAARKRHHERRESSEERVAARPALTDRLARSAEVAETATRAATAARTELEVLRGRADDPSVTAGGLVALRPLTAGSTVTFPIAGAWNFIDSWGFPRSGGRWHQGADIFSPRSTPIVAVEDGVLFPTTNRLGGLVVYLDGASGNRYYYAHLAALAEKSQQGAHVQAGEVIGFVGTSGNAAGTPPHVHFEVKPGGGEPINPYPLLKSLSEAVNSARTAGATPSIPDDVLLTLDAITLVDLAHNGMVIPPSVVAQLPGSVVEVLVTEGVVDPPIALPGDSLDPPDDGESASGG